VSAELLTGVPVQKSEKYFSAAIRIDSTQEKRASRITQEDYFFQGLFYVVKLAVLMVKWKS
jgi:hypothetical protein